eukprot:g31748.t1
MCWLHRHARYIRSRIVQRSSVEANAFWPFPEALSEAWESIPSRIFNSFQVLQLHAPGDATVQLTFREQPWYRVAVVGEHCVRVMVRRNCPAHALSTIFLVPRSSTLKSLATAITAAPHPDDHEMIVITQAQFGRAPRKLNLDAPNGSDVNKEKATRKAKTSPKGQTKAKSNKMKKAWEDDMLHDEGEEEEEQEEEPETKTAKKKKKTNEEEDPETKTAQKKKTNEEEDPETKTAQKKKKTNEEEDPETKTAQKKKATDPEAKKKNEEEDPKAKTAQKKKKATDPETKPAKKKPQNEEEPDTKMTKKKKKHDEEAEPETKRAKKKKAAEMAATCEEEEPAAKKTKKKNKKMPEEEEELAGEESLDPPNDREPELVETKEEKEPEAVAKKEEGEENIVEPVGEAAVSPVPGSPPGHAFSALGSLCTFLQGNEQMLAQTLANVASQAEGQMA